MNEVVSQAKVLTLLKSLSSSGLTPISLDKFMVFSYLAANIGTTWGVKPLESAFLKNDSQPYSPQIEKSITSLVSKGLVRVSDIRIDVDNKNYDIDLELDLERSLDIFELLNCFDDEIKFSEFTVELAFAFRGITEDRRKSFFKSDVTWDDPAISDGRLIDMEKFLIERRLNPASNVIDLIQEHTPNTKLNNHEKLAMYIRLLIGRDHD